MGGLLVGSDGLTDEDRDQSQWTKSDKICEACGEEDADDFICYGDEVVVLRLVYPAPCNGAVTLLDALDEDDGSYTADPVLFCFRCWDNYGDELRSHLNDLFISRRKSVGPSPLKCSYCQTPLNWGDYCGHAMYGELDLSPRTRETTFKVSPFETLENAELICLDCLGWINEDCGENIWPHLWVDTDG